LEKNQLIWVKIELKKIHGSSMGFASTFSGEQVMKRRFLLTAALGLAAVMMAANASQAQSYFYGYYYPDEHRFFSTKPNMGIYTYSTVTPMWNALHDSQYGNTNGLVPTGSPLLGPSYPSRIMPSGSGGYSTAPAPGFGQSLSGASQAPAAAPQASIRVIVPDPQAMVYFGDYQTKSTGTDRVYQSPAINPGTYSYQIKVAYNQGGQQVAQQRTITVTPGQSVLVDFSGTQAVAAPATSAVSRNDR
jgi:uncharacterized protein (TIGR03000 family)